MNCIVSKAFHQSVNIRVVDSCLDLWTRSSHMTSASDSQRPTNGREQLLASFAHPAYFCHYMPCEGDMTELSTTTHFSPNLVPGDELCLEPKLPPELEREIFEFAAISDPRCFGPLILVARRVKTWYRFVRSFTSNSHRSSPGSSRSHTKCSL
jgi:hypothetical protein